MEAYSGFAEVYDLFMDNVPYEAWGRYVVRQLRRYGVREGIVLDLGCGTGKMTRFLAKEGYDMIGADLSGEMLDIARRKKSPGADILYLNQDMRELELYGTVRAVISVCDSVNYITEEKDLLRVFSLVNNYLDPGGIFLFDLNTPYKYRELLAENTICENREESSFIWENYYDADTQRNEYDLTLFIREEDGRYQKYEETHYQRAYSIEKIKELIEASGLKWIACREAFCGQAPQKTSERVTILAQECEKNKGGSTHVRLHRKGDGSRRTNPRVCHHVKGTHRNRKAAARHKPGDYSRAGKAVIRRGHDGRDDEGRKRSSDHTNSGQRPGERTDGYRGFFRTRKGLSGSAGCDFAAECTGQVRRRRRAWPWGVKRH